MAIFEFPANVQRSDIGGLYLVPFKKTGVSLTANTAGINVTGTITVPTGTSFYGVICARLGSYILPYFTTSGSGHTNIQSVTVSGSGSNNLTIKIDNMASAWNNYELNVMLAFK